MGGGSRSAGTGIAVDLCVTVENGVVADIDNHEMADELVETAPLLVSPTELPGKCTDLTYGHHTDEGTLRASRQAQVTVDSQACPVPTNQLDEDARVQEHEALRYTHDSCSSASAISSSDSSPGHFPMMAASPERVPCGSLNS